MTFIITCRLAVPLILIALAVVSVVGASLSVVMLTLGLLLWDRFAVVTRAAASQIRSLDYVAAARAAGCSRFYILTRDRPSSQRERWPSDFERPSPARHRPRSKIRAPTSVTYGGSCEVERSSTGHL